MNKEELFQKVEDVIVDSFEIDRALIKPEAELVIDLDFDSFDAIELILQLEDQYDAKISAEKYHVVRSIHWANRDFAEYKEVA